MTTLKHHEEALRAWDGQVAFTYDGLQLAVLWSIRNELKKLNFILGCPNVAAGFRALQRIAKQDEAAFKRRVAKATEKRIQRKSK